MSLPTENPIVLNLTSTFGFMLIGVVFCFVIWGVTCMQTFMYFAGFPDDHNLMKAIIFSLWAIDTANVALLLTGLWPPLLGHWGSIAVVNSNVPDLLHHNWLSGIITAVVQFVFLWRIYRLGGHSRWTWLTVSFVSFVALYDFATTVAYSVIGLQGGTLATETEPRMKGLQISNRSCTAAADIVICISLITLLLQNGVPRYSSTRRLLYRSIIVTVNSGLWTAILAIIDLSLMSAQPHGFAYCMIEFPLPSFYLVTLLSNLNARDYVRGRRTEWNEYLTAIPDEPSMTTNGTPKNYDVHVLSDFVVARDQLTDSDVRHTAGTTIAGGSAGGSNTAFEKTSSDDYKV